MISEKIKEPVIAALARCVPSDVEAAWNAIKNAEKDSLVIVSSDVVPDALNLVMKLREKERTAV